MYTFVDERQALFYSTVFSSSDREAAYVIDGLMRVQLDSQVPVISAVLTPHAFHEHETHRTFFAEHFVAKGREAAEACLATVAMLDRVKLAA